ncbi:MAG: Mrp/NBP35 family ATP-binding protein [Lachnospiraceae bacterium]|nr:Mrp/NBP35 family ATP-binding protein [Lachnospiraceae bacterium]
MAECTHDCSTCSESCGERTSPQSFLEKQNEASDVKKVIGVVSGKGGVGKSMTTALLASALQKAGKKVAVLDADITGPSIPKMFGLMEKAASDGTYIHPAITKSGIKVMSMNLLLNGDTDPVVWRGPVIAGAVKQFWTDVLWDEVDVMLVDMPPGTGDVPLTVFQSLPVDGIVVVTSPQDLVSMIVGKAVNMAKLMNIPVVGLVENMAYFTCPDCGKKHYLFGEPKLNETAERFGIALTAELPIDPAIAKASDEGRIEEIEAEAFDAFASELS